MPYVDPQTSQEWQDVAFERRCDAETLHTGKRSVATLYFLGFAVESYAKALCVANGKAVPKGADGHDIITILDRAGVGRAVLPLAVREFAENRDVSLRYQAQLPAAHDLDAELDGARRLIQWCITRLTRPNRRRR